MKTITYRGEQYEVEDWVNFVAMDGNLALFGYKNEPTCYGQVWDCDNVNERHFISYVQPEWRDSLEKV